LRIYQRIDLPEKQIFEFCQEIYPQNEELQSQFIQKCIAIKLISKNPSNLAALAKFCDQMSNAEFAIAIINRAKDKLLLRPREIFDLVKDRSKSQYSHIYSLLQSHNLKESISESSFTELQQKLGNLDSFNLANIFSYFDLIGGHKRFTEIIKPEISQQIRQSFQAPQNKPYLSAQEHSNLCDLFDAPNDCSLFSFE
jgi:hypothetical protein